MSLPTQMDVGAPDAVCVWPRVQFEDRLPLGPQLEPDGGAEVDRTRMGAGHGEEKQFLTLEAIDGGELETQFGYIGEHLAHDSRVTCLVDDHELTGSDLVLESANSPFDFREAAFESPDSGLQWIVSIWVSGHVASSSVRC